MVNQVFSRFLVLVYPSLLVYDGVIMKSGDVPVFASLNYIKQCVQPYYVTVECPTQRSGLHASSSLVMTFIYVLEQSFGTILGRFEQNITYFFFY